MDWLRHLSNRPNLMGTKHLSRNTFDRNTPLDAAKFIRLIMRSWLIRSVFWCKSNSWIHQRDVNLAGSSRDTRVVNGDSGGSLLFYELQRILIARNRHAFCRLIYNSTPVMIATDLWFVSAMGMTAIRWRFSSKIIGDFNERDFA